jgi:hypothetical protein
MSLRRWSVFGTGCAALAIVTAAAIYAAPLKESDNRNPLGSWKVVAAGHVTVIEHNTIDGEYRYEFSVPYDANGKSVVAGKEFVVLLTPAWAQPGKQDTAYCVTLRGIEDDDGKKVTRVGFEAVRLIITPDKPPTGGGERDLAVNYAIVVK